MDSAKSEIFIVKKLLMHFIVLSYKNYLGVKNITLTELSRRVSQSKRHGVYIHETRREYRLCKFEFGLWFEILRWRQ